MSLNLKVTDSPAFDPNCKIQSKLYDYEDRKATFKSLMECIEERAKEYANAQNKELLAWKESALSVMNGIDLQAVGKELNITLGASISENILPGIKVYKQLLQESASVIGRLRRSMMAHPDHEEGSKFDDYTTLAQEMEDKIKKVIKPQL